MKYAILKHCASAFLTLPTSISTYLSAYMLILASLPLGGFLNEIWKESARETRPTTAVTPCMNSTPALISQPASHFQPQVFVCKQYKIRGHSSPHLKGKKRFAHTFYHITESKQFLLRMNMQTQSVPSILCTTMNLTFCTRLQTYSFFLLGLQFGCTVYQSVFHSKFGISYFTDHKACFFSTLQGCTEAVNASSVKPLVFPLGTLPKYQTAGPE